MPTTTAPHDGELRPVRAALLKKVCGDEGHVRARQLGGARGADGDPRTTRARTSLAYYVLSDVALTQRILRLANTSDLPHRLRHRRHHHLARDLAARLRQRQDHRAGDAAGRRAGQQRHAHSVRVELEGGAVRQPGRPRNGAHSFYQGAEEASIGALFKNLGPLLVASHEHARYREIARWSRPASTRSAQAAQMILGCSYDACPPRSSTSGRSRRDRARAGAAAAGY
jgi:hypothetical protein